MKKTQFLLICTILIVIIFGLLLYPGTSDKAVSSGYGPPRSEPARGIDHISRDFLGRWPTLQKQLLENSLVGFEIVNSTRSYLIGEHGNGVGKYTNSDLGIVMEVRCSLEDFERAYCYVGNFNASLNPITCSSVTVEIYGVNYSFSDQAKILLPGDVMILNLHRPNLEENKAPFTFVTHVINCVGPLTMVDAH